MFRHPSAFLPILMSAAAFSAVLLQLAVHGPAPQPDEGAAAHVWQLLMVLQVPVIAWCAIRGIPRAPRQGLLLLALQACAVLIAMAPVYFLHW